VPQTRGGPRRRRANPSGWPWGSRSPVLGVTRSNEMRRAHRARAATANAALALIGLALAAGIVVYGLVLITRKG